METLSFLLVALFFCKSTNQNPAFSKSELLYIFFFNFNHYLKNVCQKTFENSSVTLQEKKIQLFF